MECSRTLSFGGARARQPLCTDRPRSEATASGEVITHNRTKRINRGGTNTGTASTGAPPKCARLPAP